MFGIYWFVLCVATAIIAKIFGRSFFGFLITALIISPLGALVCILVIPKDMFKKIMDNNVKQCPKCMSRVDIRAGICKHCGTELEVQEIKAPV